MKINELFDKEYISIETVEREVSALRDEIKSWVDKHNKKQAFVHMKSLGINIVGVVPLHIVFDLKEREFSIFDEFAADELIGDLVLIEPYETIDNVYIKLNSLIGEREDEISVTHFLSEVKEQDLSKLTAEKTFAVITRDNTLLLVDQEEYRDSYSDDSPHVLAVGGSSIGIDTTLEVIRPTLTALLIDFVLYGARELTAEEESSLHLEINDKKLAALRTFNGTQLITGNLDSKKIHKYISIINKYLNGELVTEDERAELLASTIGSNYGWIETLHSDKEYLYEVISSDPERLNPLYEKFMAACPNIDPVNDDGIFAVSFDGNEFAINTISSGSLDWLFGASVNIKNPREIADYLARV